MKPPPRRTIPAMPRVARGHVEQLPSGSFRTAVYAGVDPLTRRPVYLTATARTEKQAQVELGKLLGKASDGRRPESDATVAKLLEEYTQIAGWDLSTRESNLGYIRRTIKPALAVTLKKRPATALADVVKVIGQPALPGSKTSRCTYGSPRLPVHEEGTVRAPDPRH